MSECSNCNASLAPEARFCRSCGSPVQDEPSTVIGQAPATCTACGGTLAAGAAFCRACGTPAGQSETPGRPLEAAGPAAPPPPPVPPLPTAPPPVSDGGRSGAFVAAIVVLVLLFGAGGGTAAYFLLVKDDSPEAVSSALPGLGDDRTREPVVIEGSGLDDETSGTGTETETGTGTEIETETETETSSDPDSPEAILRLHFEDIDAGDYDSAWQLLHPDYQNTSGVNWVSEREKENARIEVREIYRLGEPDRDMIRLQAEIVAADTTGEGAGVCRLFSGWTRMQKSGSAWRYRPGKIDGVAPGFSDKVEELDSSDPRCAAVLE